MSWCSFSASRNFLDARCRYQPWFFRWLFWLNLTPEILRQPTNSKVFAAATSSTVTPGTTRSILTSTRAHLKTSRPMPKEWPGCELVFWVTNTPPFGSRRFQRDTRPRWRRLVIGLRGWFLVILTFLICSLGVLRQHTHGHPQVSTVTFEHWCNVD